MSVALAHLIGASAGLRKPGFWYIYVCWEAGERLLDGQARWTDPADRQALTIPSTQNWSSTTFQSIPSYSYLPKILSESILQEHLEQHDPEATSGLQAHGRSGGLIRHAYLPWPASSSFEEAERMCPVCNCQSAALLACGMPFEGTCHLQHALTRIKRSTALIYT